MTEPLHARIDGDVQAGQLGERAQTSLMSASLRLSEIGSPVNTRWVPLSVRVPPSGCR